MQHVGRSRAMSDHDIDDKEPEGISYVKRLQIFVSGDNTGPLNKLRFHIYGFTKDFDDVRKGAGMLVDMGDIDDCIERFVNEGPVYPDSVELLPTPLDFAIKRPC